MKPNDVMSLIKEKKVQAIDLRFIDLPGLWQHFSVTSKEFSADVFEEGIGFDGSSIRGFQAIQESDMLLFPDPASAFLDPFTAHPTLVMICNVKDPVTGESYTRDPRYIATKAESYLKSSGLADTAYFGPEPEFFVFDDVRFDQLVQLRVLLPRLRRGLLERRQAAGGQGKSRLQGSIQGRLFPRPADGHPAGYPDGNVPDDGAGWH